MDKNLEDLKHIRSMMERSSKFLSLSGISGVCAGSFALIGAVIAHQLLIGKLIIFGYLPIDLMFVAGIVLIFASSFGLYFSLRKARKTKSRFWTPVTKQLAIDFFIPMFVGGLFCLIQIYNHQGRYVSSSMLIFYGLALFSIGSRTYRDIKILGLCEIVLGLICAIFPSIGLRTWALGFGILHIVYGITMYYKYDRKEKKESEV